MKIISGNWRTVTKFLSFFNPLGGSGDVAPQKILKSGVFEMPLPAFFSRGISHHKYNCNWDISSEDQANVHILIVLISANQYVLHL